MKKQEWIIVFLPLAIVWYLDQVTKSWAVNLQGLQSYGYLHFALHHNPGAMLGLFSDLPAFLRIVTLSTGGAFLVVIYALIQYLLPLKSLILRCGMSILLGGILGNVTDRIIYGHVVDFIILGAPDKYVSPAFNISDVVQWVGYIMIVFAIIKDGEILWPEHNSRRQYWINFNFQIKYCFLLLGIGFSISLIAMVFSYTYLRVALIEVIGPNPQLVQKFLIPFLITFAVICIGFSVALFTVGKIISHKIAGPIYAFEKYMDDLMHFQERKTVLRQFKLRSQDEFKELETIAKNVKEKIAPEVQEEIALHPATESPEDNGSV